MGHLCGGGGCQDLRDWVRRAHVQPELVPRPWFWPISACGQHFTSRVVSALIIHSFVLLNILSIVFNYKHSICSLKNIWKKIFKTNKNKISLP